MVTRLLGALTLLAATLLGSLPASAQVTTSPPQWQLSGWQRGGATLDLDFVHDRYWLNGTSYSGVTNFISGAGATFSRNSVGTYFDSTGTLQTAAANVPRLDYGATGGSNPLGILIEQASTNSVQNDTMQGVVATDGIERTNNGTLAGCSGSSCTGWGTTLNGGTGTVSFTSGQATLTGDGTNAATVYQTITTAQSCLYKVSITSGSTGALTYQAGGSVGAGTIYPIPSGATTNFEFRSIGSTTVYAQINNTSTTAATISQMSVVSEGCHPTMTGAIGDSEDGDASTTHVITQYVGHGAESGIPYYDIRFLGMASKADFIRIYFDAYSTIFASSGQTWTESVYLRLVGGSYTNVNLCGYHGSETLDIQENQGSPLYTAVNDNFGSASSLPTNAALSTQRYIDTATLSNSATKNIMPMLLLCNNTGAIDFTLRIGMPQLEQLAFATSVIPTSGSPVTRQSDVFTVPVTAAGANGAWYTQGVGTLFVNGIAPVYFTSGSPYYYGLADVDDGTPNNAIQLWVFAPGGTAKAEIEDGANNFTYSEIEAVSQGTNIKDIIAFASNNVNSAINGTLLGLSPSQTIPTMSVLRVGNLRGGTAAANGWISRVWYMPTRQPDATLAAYTQ